MSSRRGASQSGQRRRVVRAQAACKAVIALSNGTKHDACLLDVSTGGMHLECTPPPAYGASLTVVVRFDDRSDWMILPGTVRWFSGAGFGVEFSQLDPQAVEALEAFVDRVAA